MNWHNHCGIMLSISDSGKRKINFIYGEHGYMDRAECFL